MNAAEAMDMFTYDANSGVLRWRETDEYHLAGQPVGWLLGTGYLAVEKRGVFKSLLVHRIIWLISHGAWPTGVIDHLNGVRTDNRLANLRDISHAQNCQNQRSPQKGSKSGFLGVTWDKERSLWRAQITHTENGKTRCISLGRFNSIDAAHAAYLIKKRELHPGCTL